jgi:hypothetical protein
MCLLLQLNLGFPAEEARNIGSRMSLSGYIGVFVSPDRVRRDSFG